MVNELLSKRLNCCYRAVVFGLAAAALLVLSGLRPAQADQPVKMTIGYQSLWATGGEIFEALRRTNILELNGIKAEFKIFTWGAPLGEAAVAGEIDNIFASDVPVVRTVARIPGAQVVARTHDYRFAVISQPDFKGGLADLRGKTLSGAIGGTIFPRALEHIVAAGVKEPFKEINIINQDVAEQPAALQGKSADAVATWDPTLEKLVQSGFRVVWVSGTGEASGWMGLTGSFLKKYGEDGAVRFIKSWIMAAWWTSNNLETAHEWFKETSRIGTDLLKASAQADRYLKAPTADIKSMDFVIDDSAVAASQRVIKMLFERNLLKDQVEVAPMLHMSYVKQAQADIAAGKHPKLSDIQVVSK